MFGEARCIARSTRSGTIDGPGMARVWGPYERLIGEGAFEGEGAWWIETELSHDAGCASRGGVDTLGGRSICLIAFLLFRVKLAATR